MSVIRIEKLTKTFVFGFFRKKVQALQGIDLEVQANEIFGFLGPNGAGKTTTIKTLMGLIYPNSGNAYLFDREIRNVEIKNRLGFLPEQPYFYDYLRGEEFLDFIARLFGISSAERRRRVPETLELVGLKDAGTMQLRKYSKGMLQRIGLGQALINDPELVILDEPMSGLDPVGRRDVREIIFRLKAKGKTVFFSTHILPDVEMICDRVGIINKGRMIFVGQSGDFLKTRARTVDLQFNVLSEEAEKALAGLFAGQADFRVVRKSDSVMVTIPGDEWTDRTLDLTRSHGARLISMTPHRDTLEEQFLRQIETQGGAGQ